MLTGPDESSLITFPCLFPMKIVGNNTEFFASEIYDIVHQHDPKFTHSLASHNISSHGKYCALSVKVHAENQENLNALYQDLLKHKDIKMVL